MAKKKEDKKEFVVYKVTDWRLYHDEDPFAKLIEDGLYYWEAHQLCNKLNIKSGLEPTGGYKVCHISDWEKHLEKFREYLEMKPLSEYKQLSLFE